MISWCYPMHINKGKKSGKLFEDCNPADEHRSTMNDTVNPAGGVDGPDESLATGVETILLVDDDPVIIDVARDMLEILGYRVIATQQGSEAVDIYARQKDEIDLVIQDMVMPGMNGADVFHALKKIDPEVRVILVSGYAMNKQIATVMEQGCRGFIPKPFRLEDLSVKVREVLDSP